VRSHFWPFADVQNGNPYGVTRKCGHSFKPKERNAGKTLFGSLRVKDSLCSLRLLAKAFGVVFCYEKNVFGELPKPSRRGDCSLASSPRRAPRGRPYRFVLSVRSVVKLFRLFLAEFLESGIGAQRVPDRIKPKKGRRNRRWHVNVAMIGRF
jgi:hypothetical protein